MKRFLLIATLFFFTPPALASDTQTVSDTKAVSDYIRYFKRNVKPSLQRRALKLVPLIVSISKKYKIDPMLVTIMIRFESSFVPGVVGAVLGERGLLQVHGVALKGRKLATVADEIDAGVLYLVACQRRCKNDLWAINRYMSGRCMPVFRNPRKRYKHYLWAVEKFKNGG